MKKTAIVLLLLALLGVAAYALSQTRGIGSPVDMDLVEGEHAGDPDAPVNNAEVRGVVTAVDLEQAMFDGPYVVMVRESNGDEEIIAVPSMGIMLCAAREDIADVSTIKEGMTVEARGNLTAQGDIVPCESASHYLRVVSR